MDNVLSLFDGISAGQLALNILGFKYYKYYASEVDKPAIKVTQHNFPNTVQLGDVRHINGRKLHNIKLIMGGSPCTDFTIMGHRKGMVTTDNVKVKSLDDYLKLKNEGFEFHGESFLFWEYIRLWKETNAKYFFLENVGNMDKEWVNIISDTLGVKPIEINSSLFTAQNRSRLYWTNIPNVTTPTDKKILLGDIIPGAISGAGIRGIPDHSKGLKPDGRKYYKPKLSVRKDNKANCLVCGTTTAKYLHEDGKIYDLTPEQCEQLQTFPVGYTNVIGVPKYQRYNQLGNSWTVEVIVHLFSGLKKLHYGKS